MKRFLHLFAPVVLMVGALTLAGCAAMQSNTPRASANGQQPTTQAQTNGTASNYANSDNTDIGNGAFGETPP